MTEAGRFGCNKPGHPKFHSHNCATWDAAIAKLPPALRPVDAQPVEDNAPTGGLASWDF